MLPPPGKRERAAAGRRLGTVPIVAAALSVWTLLLAYFSYTQHASAGGGAASVLGSCSPACAALATPVVGPDKYVNASTASLFMKGLSHLPFHGDLARNDYAAWNSAALSAIQRAAGVFGAVGEIGVHHGFYFIALALTARKGEPLFALDLFQAQQSKNLDKSGFGDRKIFLHNVATVGIPPEAVAIHEGLSTDLSDAQMCQKVGARFRFLSIDGGHTKDIVLNDMKFAECCLVDGGIAAMDDYSNMFWPGVLEGASAYFDRYGSASRLAPLMMHGNKLYVTTKTHHARYLKAVTGMKFWDAACKSDVFVHQGKHICMEAPGVNTGNAYKQVIGGHGVAIAEHRLFDVGMASALWKDSLDKC